MIWVAGAIRPDDGLAISVLDRTFEHGLGLFETLRTWGGRATLLEGHKARLLASGEALGLGIDPASLPGFEDVRRLLDTEGFPGDRMLRITASGGTASTPPVVWMRAGPLPEPLRAGGAVVEARDWFIGSGDPTARHKTLNYWSRRIAYEEARGRGRDETLGLRPGWGYCEGVGPTSSSSKETP